MKLEAVYMLSVFRGKSYTVWEACEAVAQAADVQLSDRTGRYHISKWRKEGYLTESDNRANLQNAWEHRYALTAKGNEYLTSQIAPYWIPAQKIQACLKAPDGAKLRNPNGEFKNRRYQY